MKGLAFYDLTLDALRIKTICQLVRWEPWLLELLKEVLEAYGFDPYSKTRQLNFWDFRVLSFVWNCPNPRS